MKTTVLFLGGEQGSGKSSAAEFIQEALLSLSGESVFIFKYADTIYQLHDLIEKQFSAIIDREPLKKNGPLLQILGTEIGRNLYDKDIWVKATEYKIRALSQAPDDKLIIVEDVRFENELDLAAQLKEDGMHTFSIYFEAPEEIRKKRVESFRSNTNHQSEAELSKFKDKFQYKVTTSGSIEDKQKALLQILKENGVKVPTPEGSAEILVDDINYFIESWEDATGYGANFEWFYTKEGKKRLRIKDLAPIEKLPQDKAATKIQEVQKFMEGIDGQLEL